MKFIQTQESRRGHGEIDIVLSLSENDLVVLEYIMRTSKRPSAKDEKLKTGWISFKKDLQKVLGAV